MFSRIDPYSRTDPYGALNGCFSGPLPGGPSHPSQESRCGGPSQAMTIEGVAEGIGSPGHEGEWVERVRRLNDIENRLRQLSLDRGLSVHEGKIFNRKSLSGEELPPPEGSGSSNQEEERSQQEEHADTKAAAATSVPPLNLNQKEDKMAHGDGSVRATNSLLNAPPSTRRREKVTRIIEYHFQIEDQRASSPSSSPDSRGLSLEA